MNLNRILCGSLLGLPFSVVAAVNTAGDSAVGSIVQLIFALMLVLGLIIAVAWMMRRFSLVPGGANAQMRVVSGVMVGTRERVVIVEVKETWLVLGVTSEQVNLLHTLDRPAESAAASAPVAPPFAVWLQKAIAKRKVQE